MKAVHINQLPFLVGALQKVALLYGPLDRVGKSVYSIARYFKRQLNHCCTAFLYPAEH